LRESEEKKAAMALLDGVGATVYHFSDNRSSRNTPGVPDAWVFITRPGRLGWAFWWEAKGTEGEQSEEQKAFQVLCRACSVPYVLGGAEAVHEHLERIGVLAR
jgi:hypothetical protein